MVNETDPHRIVLVYTFLGMLKARTAAGVERTVPKAEFIEHFHRLYPGKRLPWEGDRPSHAVSD